MNKKHIIVIIVVAVIAGAGGFFGGMQLQKSKTPKAGAGFGNLTAAQRQQFASGQSGSRARTAGGNFAGGQIISKDDKSITVKTQDGSTKIVYYSSSTEINKPTTVDSSQMAVGDNVIVTGTTNTDGSSVTASNIQIRPAGEVMPGQGRGQASSTPGQ